MWELIKYNIRNFTIRHSKNKVKHIRCNESKLEKRLMVLEHENHSDKTIAKEYEDVKKKLSIIEKEKIDGLILGSKVKWHEEGEKSTRYFFNLEKQNANRKHIRKLKLDDDSQITDEHQILKEEKRFYCKLYNQKVDKSKFEINSICFFNCQDIPTLEENNKNACEGNLTENECFKSLQTFKKNKSPGNDGLSYEFYLKFWNVLKNRFVECFNYAYTTKQMSPSQRQAVITLLDKKNKDRNYLKNGRPISQLNSDHKIASKAMAYRLKKVLPSIINNDQSGFVNNRNIAFALRTVLDIIEIADQNKLDGLMMMIDFEKAFDMVNHNFMFETLSKFNLGISFINWVKNFIVIFQAVS